MKVSKSFVIIHLVTLLDATGRRSLCFSFLFIFDFGGERSLGSYRID